ncbi:Putative winged helix-like DNA-binding domain superfamily [Septoria linicola]|uniref:Winged helix-like DNA-binding domain superfamily n=1 Tax=Septoria linicola TaxID=215465 RepID=A0A9Q9AKX7_9PEZI|nr:Putative winged helix-like DNA-binding domain superfamily [Septoria linicola]
MSDDGAADQAGNILKHHLEDFLQRREPPKTFCPSEVARALTTDELRQLQFHEWRDAMPAIRGAAWALRDEGRCEIVQKGKSVGDIGPEDVRGPIRIRRAVD